MTIDTDTLLLKARLGTADQIFLRLKDPDFNQSLSQGERELLECLQVALANPEHPLELLDQVLSKWGFDTNEIVFKSDENNIWYYSFGERLL